jgi:hypothetical protein
VDGLDLDKTGQDDSPGNAAGGWLSNGEVGWRSGLAEREDALKVRRLEGLGGNCVRSDELRSDQGLC